MKSPKTPDSTKEQRFEKTTRTNLVRHVSTGGLYARLRINRKLKWKSLRTDKLTVADVRLQDFLKRERRIAENQDAVAKGNMTFNDALVIYLENLNNDGSLKPRTKEYWNERIKALLKSWPELKGFDVRKITKTECLKWSARFRKTSSASSFNNTVGALKNILAIAVEAGLRYENPAEQIKRTRVLQKPVPLPSITEFLALLDAITQTKVRYSNDCKDLVSFLAYGGFRKGEAARITWGDCDFDKGIIHVQGDPATGTKNWSHRFVPMIGEMRELLITLKNKRGDESASATVMKIKECQGALTSACKRAGVKRITHHDLRHLFATRCIESTVDIPTLSKWLGHKDGGALAMKTYGHLRDQHSSEMAQKVSFKPQEPQANVIPLAQEAAQDQAAAQDVQGA